MVCTHGLSGCLSPLVNSEVRLRRSSREPAQELAPPNQGAMAEMVLPPAPPNMTYKVEKLNPLAFPKGMDLRCELTGKPALVPQHVEAPTLTTAQESHGPRERHWRGSGSATGKPRENPAAGEPQEGQARCFTA